MRLYRRKRCEARQPAGPDIPHNLLGLCVEWFWQLLLPDREARSRPHLKQLLPTMLWRRVDQKFAQ
jgi:hypothetical protein